MDLNHKAAGISVGIQGLITEFHSLHFLICAPSTAHKNIEGVIPILY